MEPAFTVVDLIEETRMIRTTMVNYVLTIAMMDMVERVYYGHSHTS